MHAKMQQHSGQITASYGLVAKCHAGEMERFVFLVLLVHRVATEIPSGLTIDLCKHAAKCHAGELIHVAWEERPAIAAAMDLIGHGNGWVITATKGKGDLGWSEKCGERCVQILELA
jgi:hypothetical protein